MREGYFLQSSELPEVRKRLLRFQFETLLILFLQVNANCLYFFWQPLRSFSSLERSHPPSFDNVVVLNSLIMNTLTIIGNLSFWERCIKNIVVQSDFRFRAQKYVEEALKDNLRLIEIEFPPLIGGDQVKWICCTSSV